MVRMVVVVVVVMMMLRMMVTHQPYPSSRLTLVLTLALASHA